MNVDVDALRPLEQSVDANTQRRRSSRRRLRAQELEPRAGLTCKALRMKWRASRARLRGPRETLFVAPVEEDERRRGVDVRCNGSAAWVLGLSWDRNDV